MATYFRKSHVLVFVKRVRGKRALNLNIYFEIIRLILSWLFGNRMTISVLQRRP